MEGISNGSLQPRIRTVYYSGTDTLNEGYCLCFDQDYGTAASADPTRCYNVEKPSTSNVRFFAGVVAPGQNGKVGPCEVAIFEPGSKGVNVYAYVSATINATKMTVCAGQYYMYKEGFDGEGSAIARQTIDRSSTAGLVMADLMTGPASCGVEIYTPANGAKTDLLVGGVTYFPATTIGTANMTYTLADGTRLDQKKAFICEGTMTTNDIVVTVATPAAWPGVAAGPLAVSTYNTYTMDAAGEHLYATWNGKAWIVWGTVGSTV